MSRNDLIHDLRTGIISTIVGSCLLIIDFFNNSVPFLLNLGLLFVVIGITMIVVTGLDIYKHKKGEKDLN